MQCLVDHASTNPGPSVRVLGAENDEIDRDTEIAEGFAESYELRATAFQLRLDDEQIKVAVRTTLASSAGAKQDHLGIRRGCG